jgi:hypothetical protein
MDEKIIRRPSKTIKLNIKENWNITYGTFNNKNPKTVYIIMQSWVKPIQNDFIDIFKNLEYLIKHCKISLNDIFQNRIISSFDIAQSKMKINKKSLLKIKIHFIQKECKPFLETKNSMIEIIEGIIKNIEKLCEEILEFYGKK